MSNEQENSDPAAHSTPNEVPAALTNAIEGFIAARDAKNNKTSSETPISTPSIEERRRPTHSYGLRLRRPHAFAALIDEEDVEMTDENVFAAPAPRHKRSRNGGHDSNEDPAPHAAQVLNEDPPELDYEAILAASHEAEVAAGGGVRAAPTLPPEVDRTEDFEPIIREQLERANVTNVDNRQLLIEILKTRFFMNENAIRHVKWTEKLTDALKSVDESVKNLALLNFKSSMQHARISDQIQDVRARIRHMAAHTAPLPTAAQAAADEASDKENRDTGERAEGPPAHQDGNNNEDPEEVD